MPAPVPAFIERLDRQRDGALATIDGILDRLNADEREPTDIEQQTLTDARATLERSQSGAAEWTEILEARAGGDELRNRVHGALARSGQAMPTGRVDRDGGAPAELGELWRSAGEYAADFVFARGHAVGYGTDRQAEQAQQRLERAVANQITTDNPGILPTPIIGPVVTALTQSRPLLQGIQARPMPGGGKTFTRPVVSQHSLVGAQAAEKTELPSRTMKLDPLQVTKTTYGGALDISFQDRDWTDPAILQIVIDDLASQYALQTDAAAATAFAAAVTLTVPLADATNPEEWLGAIYTAAAQIAGSMANQLPDTIFASVDVWRALGILTDVGGRPLFPVLGPNNADGQMSPGAWASNPFGLRLVVDGQLPAKTAIVGISSQAEYYEQLGGMVSVTEPSILGYTVAYYGYFASCVPMPTAFRAIAITTMPALEDIGGPADTRTDEQRAADEQRERDERAGEGGGVTGGRRKTT